MNWVEIPSAALGLAVISCIGRSVLSWLPPGEIGSHRTSELPTTWAASYLLGSVAIAAGASVAALSGSSVSCPWLAAAAAALAVARWLTLPAGLVPRHEVLQESPGAAARAVFLLALGIGVFACASARIEAGVGLWAVRAQAWLSQGWLIGFDGPASSRGALELPPLDCGAIACVSWPFGIVSELAARAHLFACFIAALLLVERALVVARRAPLGRRLFVLLLAVALAAAVNAEDGDLALAALCALALLGLVSWTRRADARGLALACIAWSALPLVRPGGWAITMAGLGATLAATARPSIRRALVWSLGCALTLLALWPLAAWLRNVPFLRLDPMSALSSSWALGENLRVTTRVAPIWIAFGAAIGPAVLQLIRPTPTGNADLDAGNADRPRRDLVGLLMFATMLAWCAILLVLVADAPKLLLAKTWAPGLLVQTAPLAAILAGRVLVRAERAD